MNNKKKEILFIAGTHGDEPIGLEVMKEIEKENCGEFFDWTIGNPMACCLGMRACDSDLNRAAPGALKSDIYESRRAAQLIEFSKKYKYTIDIHATSKDTGIFIIITNPSEENLKLASLLAIEKIVILPSFSEELRSPLSEYFSCGLEIECGPKSDKKLKFVLSNIIIDFVKNYRKREKLDYSKILSTKEIYLLNGRYDGETIGWKEFKKVEVGNNKFYPLFIGSYENIGCYKMQKIKIN